MSIKKDLIKALERANSKGYKHLIIDLNGLVATSKVEATVYSAKFVEIFESTEDEEVVKKLHKEYWTENIRLIAFSPDHYEGDSEGLIELNKTYSQFLLNELTLFINGDFTTQGLATLLHSLDYIYKNYEELK